MTVVGHVVALWRSWHGVAGDRRWAFIRDGQVRTPDRCEFDVADPALACELGPDVRVIKRCVMVTIDPVTLRKSPAVLRVIARDRGARFGVYGSTVEPGRVTVGDQVELEP